MDVKWEPLVLKNTGLDSLRGYLTEEGKLFVENTPEANLVGFMPSAWRPTAEAVKNPENALIVAGPPPFVGEWLCEGRDNEHADAYTYPSFIFYRKL
ncbi:hypothetical protein [Pseudomonas psychrophila]|uniref:hypothetical protein n=1 Tax=Pseudomonas psychrophila TaxID=122355 RepID=UPI0038299604